MGIEMEFVIRIVLLRLRWNLVESRHQDRPYRQDRPLTIKVESRGISSCDN